MACASQENRAQSSKLCSTRPDSVLAPCGWDGRAFMAAFMGQHPAARSAKVPVITHMSNQYRSKTPTAVANQAANAIGQKRRGQRKKQGISRAFRCLFSLISFREASQQFFVVWWPGTGPECSEGGKLELGLQARKNSLAS